MLGEGNTLGFYFGGGWGTGGLSYTVRGRRSEAKAGSPGLQASRLAAISNLPPELQTLERQVMQPRAAHQPRQQKGSHPGPPS